MMRNIFLRTWISIIFLPVCLSTGVGTASAQDATAEALFQRARTQFLQEKYVAARLDLNELLSQYPEDRNIATARMLLAKTYFRLGDYANARLSASFLRNTPYAEWTEYLSAACQYRTGEYDEAAEILAVLASSTSDERLRDHALQAIRTSIIPVADPGIVDALLREHNIRMSDVSAAEPETVESSPFVPPVEEWIPGSSLKIGLLAPLSGMNASMGTDLYRGVQTALQNHREIDGITIELVVKDTESDLIETVLKTRELIREGVVAIIGPVYGEYSIAAALEAQHSGIPFISATVTSEGLTEIGPSVYQLSLTPGLQAKALAGFAADSLVFNDTAVIATNDEWGEKVLETYCSTFSQLGGTVLATGTIEMGARVYNYDDILMRIRNSAPELPVSGNNMIIYDNGNGYPDTLFINDYSMGEDGPRFPPIDTIDCILISALNDDVVKVARQIREYGINTVLLGDSGWRGEALRTEDVVNGAYMISTSGDLSGVIGSPFFTDDYDTVISRLDNQYSRNGYDACAVLLHCFAQGARSPATLTSALESVRDFRGVSSRITIDPATHRNTAVDFVQFRNGSLVRFDRRSLYEITDFPEFSDD